MTDFLYPFIDSDERDAGPLLRDLAESAQAKSADSISVTSSALVANREVLAQIASAMAARIRAGGRVLSFGNGGSSCDADAFTSLLGRPHPGPAIPALSLVEDRAVMTAIANDVGFDLVFARQVIAFGRPGDVAVGFSTSGNSANLMAAFTEADGRGMLTIGFAGYDGGRMAAAGGVAHCLVVGSQSVHRVQEAQSAMMLELRNAVGASLAGAIR